MRRFFYLEFSLFSLLIFFSCISFAQSSTIKVACIGNSVTQGLGLENPDATSYPAILQHLLGEKYLVKNFGHIGATLLRKGHNPFRLAVSSDVGHPTDVHPRNKREVGNRLAALALHFTYQYKSIVPNGPMPLKAIHQHNNIIIHFQYAGLKLKAADGKALRGFTVVDDKGISCHANAIIQKDKVIISIDKNEKIVEVRYGWKPYTEANLVNGAGLPTSTFRMTIQ